MVHRVLRGRKVAVIVATTAAVMMLGQSAQAIPVYLQGSDVRLVGGGHTRWNANNDSSGCESDSPGYTPMDDGERGATTDYKSDAFDGGGLLMVGPANANPDDAATFADDDGIADKTGEQFRVGPSLTEGLRVLRWDRALPKSPTLRSLIALRNTSNAPRTRDIYWDSDLGSDGSTNIRRTANGSPDLVNGSRWVVTSDSDTDPGDPAITHVLWGKQARVKTAEVVNNPNGGNECMTIRMRVRVPRKSVRHLLFFTEMGMTNGGAITSAAKFNKRTLNNALLAGIGPKVRANILNWKLG